MFYELLFSLWSVCDKITAAATHVKDNSMDNTSRFDGRGDVYARGRPKYAEGLFDYMEHTLGIAAGSIFADVGSGTGIFAGQLLRRGYKVFAVEPNGDMRRLLRRKLHRIPRQ